MPSLTETIEEYIKKLIADSSGNRIEICRRELAKKFGCVPSQINYVLDTRFPVEKGYIVESRRGGAGFIRIIKLDNGNYDTAVYRLMERLPEQITQYEAERIIDSLQEEDMISERERILLKAAVNRKTIGLKLPLRDRVRGRLLKNMLISLFNY